MPKKHPCQSPKTGISCILAALALATQMSIHAQEFRPASKVQPSKPAIIVVRHGEDLESWIQPAQPGQKDPAGIANWKKIVPEWPTYSLPAQTYKRPSTSNESQATLTVEQHGLSPVGETQAAFLRDNLPALLSYLKLEEVSQVVTKLPSAAGATPNPFDTVYPFVKEGYTDKEGNAAQLILIKPNSYKPNTDDEKRAANPVDEGLDQMLKDGTLLDGKGSTLLCWDAEGLWGLKIGKNRPWNPQSILGQLGDPSINNHFHEEGEGDPLKHGKGVPAKAARIFVFTKRDRPAGYDCTVVDIVDDKKIGKTFHITAELSVNHEGTLMKGYPGEVIGKFPGEVDDPDEQK